MCRRTRVGTTAQSEMRSATEVWSLSHFTDSVGNSAENVGQILFPIRQKVR